MPDEVGRFGTAGLSWSQRAVLGGLRAVIGPGLSNSKNLFLHGIHTYGARRASQLMPEHAVVVDFGCGNGRFSKFFARRGHTVLGTEITQEMLDGANASCADEEGCQFALTDGVHIPAADGSLDTIWACGVLRFSLFVDNPVYDKIAAEMHRVLRYGGRVVNLEVYVDRDPDVFIKDFEAAGFHTREVRVIHRYSGLAERVLARARVPDAAIAWVGERVAQARFHFDNPRRETQGLRDYYFVFEKT
jgi:ubiquinone/menaquinone biosynthesis C-methylase UbiE